MGQVVRQADRSAREPLTRRLPTDAAGQGAVESPPKEALERTLELDREYRRNRKKTPKPTSPPGDTAEQAVATLDEPAEDVEEGDGPRGWQDVLLTRLHRLSPDAFEEFVLYLLRLYGLQLTRVGGSATTESMGSAQHRSAKSSPRG